MFYCILSDILDINIFYLFDMFQCPGTTTEWEDVANVKCETRWNLPDRIGTLDGKHIQIVLLYNSGSIYFNNKHTFCIVLMALVDAEYRLRYVDIGSN